MTMNVQASFARSSPEILEIADFIGEKVAAAPFPKMILRFRNDRHAASIGLDGLNDTQWCDHLAGFTPFADNMPHPMALAYHGHQFRVYNPDIGDGRGFLCAQFRATDGRLLDLGTKGSGQTPFSRNGDGRLTLKGAVREILATEMLEALNVNTSKTFSVIETGEELWRGDEPSPTRSAVMVRLSHGHIRFGSFQRLAYQQQEKEMRRLLGYCLDKYYPEVERATSGDDGVNAGLLLSQVVPQMAELAASYMVSGFVHGVLNTDNMNISGESFDYGPWRFAPQWQPDFTAAYFDQHGLYAFARQAEAIYWNLGQLALALRLISPGEPLVEALQGFNGHYHGALRRRFCERLGIKSKSAEEDSALFMAAEKFMRASKISIDRFFFECARGTLAHYDWKNDHCHDETAVYFEEFLSLLTPYAQTGSRDHDYWQGDDPQSMDIDEVEAIWAHIADNDNWQPLYDKVTSLRKMGEAMAALRS